MKHFLQPVTDLVNFYRDGFRNLSSWGKEVWIIIIVKLFLIFLILRVFFFHDFLKEKFDSDENRSTYVLDQLTNPDLTDD